MINLGKEVIKTVYFAKDIENDIQKINLLMSYVQYIIDELNMISSNFSDTDANAPLDFMIGKLEKYIKEKETIIANLSKEEKINLGFTEGGDPIKDMGIGWPSKATKIIDLKKNVFYFYQTTFDKVNISKIIRTGIIGSINEFGMLSYFQDEDFIPNDVKPYAEDVATILYDTGYGWREWAVDTQTVL